MQAMTCQEVRRIYTMLADADAHAIDMHRSEQAGPRTHTLCWQPALPAYASNSYNVWPFECASELTFASISFYYTPVCSRRGGP